MRSIVLAALVLFASSSLPAALAEESETSLEEVLVTAQHRTESAQSIPISLFTMNAQQLEKQRITGIDSLNGLVPNLNIDRFPANNQTLRLFIRGVGLTDTQITQDAAVGVYLNGAYIARSTGLAFDVADLERIEILRGPQGTLYGRNTTGGAIRLITRKPDVENFNFEQTLSTGNLDLFSSKTSLNVPLTDNTAAKVAYFYQDVGGFMDNNGPGGDFGDRESEGFRLDFRADLTDDLTLDYSYDKSSIRYYNHTAQAVIPREAGDGLLSVIGVIAENYIDYSPERFGQLTTTQPLLPTDTRIDGHTLNIEWSISESMSFKSITAYRELDDESYIDFASGSAEGFRIDFNATVVGPNAGEDRLDLPAVRPHLEQEQFSQEFQFLGNLGDSLDYMAGLYYFYEKAQEDAGTLHHIFSASPFLGGTINNVGSEFNKIDNDALAFFTQLTWTPDILEKRLHATVGWRHSEDSRDAERTVVDMILVDNDTSVTNLLGTTFFDVKTGDTFDDDSFTFILEYDWSDTINVYGKFAEAYKSGGYNIRDPEEEGFSNGFKEEKLSSSELGFKGELFDRMMRFNLALFQQKFEDFQYNFQIPGTISGTRVFNIDEGEMSGVEMDITVVPSAGLLLQFSYAYLDSELDPVDNPFTGGLDEFSFTNAPKHTYSTVLDYSTPIGSLGLLNANVSYNFVDDRQEDSATVFKPSYDLVNARLALSEIEGLGGQWTIALWGKNLGDEDYEAFTLDNLPQASRAVIWGDGRSYGLDVSYRYF
ncbi:MAG: iron complex outermembrane receptor protein [Halioglobus sp.]|jgi:iron complex outermembrane receptor protein